MNDSARPSPPEAKKDTLQLPKAWFGSGEERVFAERLASTSERTLLLDYDGTLAPFHADKMKALPYPGVAEILRRVSGRPDTRIVLVTGRRATDLPALIEVANDVEIWGSHGREHIGRSREYTFYPPDAEQMETLATLQQEIETGLREIPLRLNVGEIPIASNGSRTKFEAPEHLEKKPASLAVHWRGLTAESQAVLRSHAEEAYRLHGDTSIERLPFDSGIEFRAAGYTKAFAVTRELEQSGQDGLIAYLGDDLTDEDAFAALQARGDSFLVRPEARPSLAKYWLKPPEELIRYLTCWL